MTGTRVVFLAVIIFVWGALFSLSIATTPKLGSWCCIEAFYNGQPIAPIEATITFLDSEYYETQFAQSSYYGRSKALYRFSAAGDTLFTELPADIITTTGGRSSSINGKLYYEIMLNCTLELWEKFGQTAVGWGFPPGAKKSCVLVATEGDSILYLKSWDQKMVLTYTYGSVRPFHNPVTFQVSMNVQKALGNFNPDGGDKVLLCYRLGPVNHELSLQAGSRTGEYEGTVDFAPQWVDSTIMYRFEILQSATSSRVVEKSNRSFVVIPFGGPRGMAFFDDRARINEIGQITLAEGLHMQESPAAAYDPFKNRYLTVWVRWSVTRDTSDLIGRFSDTNGPVGSEFKIDAGLSSLKVFPAVEFMTAAKEYMVVWMDGRNGGWDIYGIRLDDEAHLVVSSRSEADGAFAICTNDSLQYDPRLSYNPLNNTLLCVWADYRHIIRSESGIQENLDVYGQRLSSKGDLLTPGDPSDAKINFEIAAVESVDEFYPDVAHLGTHQMTVNEWLVVFSRASLPNMGNTEVWAVRIDGESGLRLDTWGRIAATGRLAKETTVGGPPWFPEFPVGYGYAYGSWIYRGSPHVESNALPAGSILQKASGLTCPLPEFLVAWTEYGAAGDIKCQRIAYYPDSTAYRLKLKTALESDTLITAALIDRRGTLPPEPMQWKTWADIPVCTDPYEQSYNRIAYDDLNGVFLIVWDDWRKMLWDGRYDPSPDWEFPPADLYGQRLWIDPADSSLMYLDESGSQSDSLVSNTPIVYTEADEGHINYPCMVYGGRDNKFFLAYEYTTDDQSIDINACLYNDASPVLTYISQGNSALPAEYSLSQNYPNPFNPVTEIEYEIFKLAPVRLEIFNAMGQKVITLCDRLQPPGKYRIKWNGRDEKGWSLPSAVYLYRLQVNNRVSVKKMVLMK